MFSLTGIPPFAGFFGKYYVFAGAVEAGMTWLAVVGVVMSLVSAYYYLRLVVMMFFREQTPVVDTPLAGPALAALILAAVGLVGFGLYPSFILNLTMRFF
jgi:NADH-quinone oxidoreductase subunit N